MMDKKFVADKNQYRQMNTEELRASFLVTDLFEMGQLKMTWTDVDRAIVGAAVPTESAIALSVSEEALAADYFAQRRELGVLNVGAAGTVSVDGQDFEMQNRSTLYIGMGSRDVRFSSLDAANPARYYLQSYPAHKAYPTKLITKEEADKVVIGSVSEKNRRTIFKTICPGVTDSCQIVMGFTQLDESSVWNSMPPHTHLRRSEVYLYFDLKENARVFHFMGEPDETRSLVIADSQAVISPSWSIHCGAGTGNYTFIWCMGGENQDFADMDFLEMHQLR